VVDASWQALATCRLKLHVLHSSWQLFALPSAFTKHLQVARSMLPKGKPDRELLLYFLPHQWLAAPSTLA
jgi:hypothetical protein